MTEPAVCHLSVLLVEDSPTQALALQESLKKHEIRVALASNGVEALERLKAHIPDAVISDIAMPKMDGFDLCRAIKSDETLKKIPVILLTGLTDPMDVVRGIASGADSFLTKPCEIQFLLNTLNNIVSSRNLPVTTDHDQRYAFFFNGQHHSLHIDQVQITNLLLSTYLNAVQKNKELEESYQKLNAVHAQIQKQNEELNKLSESKSHFLGIVTRDLKDPLSVIIGYSSILLSKLENIDEKHFKMLEKINKSSSLMLRILNNLINFSEQEKKSLPLKLGTHDLREIVKKCLDLFTAVAEKKRVVLEFDPPMTLKPVVCDAEQVMQAIHNLLANAIQFSKLGGKVLLTLSVESNFITLAVKDEGLGMAPEVQQRLIQQMTSQKISEGESGKMTGLGLLVVDKIVKAHRGKFRLESQMGQGTTVYLSLPY